MPPACAGSWRAHRFAGFALAGLAFAAAPVRAQDAQAELPQVEIVAEKPEGSLRAPAAEATVVEARRFAGEVRSVAELLGTSPGVSLHALGGPGQATTLSLRGASADQSLVLLDGIPLQGPGGGSVDLATLPATLLDRIVVSRGVLGAQFGAGALGGVVELVPRTTAAAGGGTQLSAGSAATAQLSADVEIGDGGGSGLAAIQLDTTDGAFAYSRQLTPEIAGAPWYDFTRENALARRGSALLRFSQELAPQAGLDLLLQGSAGWRGLPGPSSSPTERSRSLDQGGLLGARLRGIAGDATWSARAWGRVDRVELRGVQIAGDCADGDPGCPRSDQRSTSARVEAELGFPLGEAQWLRATASGGEEWIAGAPTGSHRRGLLALALMDDLRLPGRLSVHPALRAEVVGRNGALSPGIAAAWRPFARGAFAPLELRAGAGLAFRPPTFSELYLDQGAVLPNPDLQPEKAWSVDAGLRWRAAALTFSVGAFWSRYHQLISYEFNPPIRVRPFNVSEARIAGIELQLVALLPAGFVAEAAYSFLDAINLREGLEGGHHLSYRPPHRLFARLARRGERLEGYVEMNATSSMPRNNFDTASLPGQLLLNAGVGARVAGPLWLDVEAKNLLDDRTHEDLFQYPLPGLTLAAVARARF